MGYEAFKAEVKRLAGGNTCSADMETMMPGIGPERVGFIAWIAGAGMTAGHSTPEAALAELRAKLGLVEAAA